MFDVRYLGLRIAPSLAAMRELMEEGDTLQDVKEILDYGYPAPRKRKAGVIEKWLDRGNKTYNVVVVRDYHLFLHEELWLLIHYGKFTRGPR